MSKKLSCLSCGKTIKFPDYIEDTYEGDLACRNCGAILFIVVVGGCVKSARVRDIQCFTNRELKRLRKLRKVYV